VTGGNNGGKGRERGRKEVRERGRGTAGYGWSRENFSLLLPYLKGTLVPMVIAIKSAHMGWF